ncbi:MAG: enoyl-CoA hydratase/isomerase family protein [Rhizobiaceae bacterium]|nr:enoyl-CoA hydratase/isomerase family protein [Rhizobiaceae bacterium]MCV0407036.1 enoyl-CoA hydratase/isomerase family protein [Rhizobiaceae bacterium]
MDFSKLAMMRCTVDDGLARIVFTNAERGNPIDGPFSAELRALVSHLAGREDVRAVLITAEGRFFSVGGDIRGFAQSREGVPDIVRTWTADLHSAIARLMRMKAPVVVAAQGNVAGGAVSLAAAADIVYAADTVSFTAAFPALGFSADSGSTVTLSQRMGFSRAKRFLLMSETLKAPEAWEAGLVDYITAAETLAGEAEATARRFASGATLAYGGIKQTMVRARSQGLESQMEDEAQTLAAIAGSDDAWEGISAFMEKRKPKFRGR